MKQHPAEIIRGQVVRTKEASRAIYVLQHELTNAAMGDQVNAERLFDALLDGFMAEVKRRMQEENDQRARTSGRPHLEL
jgi:hypothetical protein